MINDTLGWACGSNSFLIRTTDAGVTWNPIYTGISNVVLQSLDFFNNNFGCVVGGNIDGGVLLKTTNGGQNWEEHNLGEYSLVSIEVFDTLRISTGGFTRIFSTLNGGDTWATTSVDGGVNTIAFADSITGFAGLLQGTVWKTTNGGVNWQIAAGLMPACGKYWIMFPDDSTGLTAGTALNLIKTTNKGLQWKSTVWNDDFNDVEFIDETKGFVISTKLYKTVDDGLSWNLANGAPGGSDILFLDSTTGFIGNDTSIYKTTDEGDNWYTTQGSGGTTKIFFINSQTGWAIGGRNIYKTTDGGENWIIQFTHPSVNFTSIYFIDSLYGWATIISSRPFKTTDGGNNWLQQTNLDIWASRDIYFVNRDTGWIVDNTSWSAVKKTVNGGLNWVTISEILNPFEFNFFPDTKHWMISGTPEKYITEDGGITWIDISSDVPSGFNSFNAVTNKLGFAVGGLGLVLRYNDTSYIPVELTFFTSLVIGNDVTLNWKTATEINNLGFQVERQETKNERNDDWDIVGFVNGNGTISEPQSYSFVDNRLQAGKYQYRLKQIDYNGTFEYSNTIEVEIGTPKRFSLNQNFPNPFNPTTQINYSVKEAGLVTVKVYDILGKEIANLVNENKEAGNYSVNFDASQLPSGVYIYNMQSGSFVSSKKMILIK